MKQSIAIIGGGACALVLACELDPDKFKVSVYEKNVALGRKFLVAGEGGLNFTHSEDTDKFIKRYSPSSFLKQAFSKFSNKEYIQWMNGFGLETFVGSSGRLFPKKGIKPVQVLNKILERIEKKGVDLFYKHEWRGFSEVGELKFLNAGKEKIVKADKYIFCLGGASWSVTGSDGGWTKYFSEKKIQINKFQSSNCAFQIDWSKGIISKIEGKTIKNAIFTCVEKVNAGEIVLTKFGIEGSGIYPLSPQIRNQLALSGRAAIHVDFKPSFSLEKIKQKLDQNSSKKNITQVLKEDLNLNETTILLLKNTLSKEEFLNTEILAHKIRSFPLNIDATGPVEDAISTVGGIDLEEINEDFELKKIKNCFVLGEMLDYDAPTGGYLLQSCFSMSMHLANRLNRN